MKKSTIRHLEVTDMEGGLARMIKRFQDEGTLTGDADSDEFLREHPEAALLGLLYDQRVLAESAFTGPQRLFERLGHLDLKRIGTMDLEKLQEIFAQKPAVHRFTNKMADYTKQVAAAMSEQYGGRAAALWDDGADIDTIRKRVAKLPGFGPGKSRKMKYVLHYLGYRDFAE